MPVFKAVSGDYKTGNDLRNLVNYAAMGKDGTQNQCGAQGVFLGEPDSMYRQMEDVKKQFHKEGNRQGMHYVLSSIWMNYMKTTAKAAAWKMPSAGH